MKVNELRERLELLDDEAELIIAIKNNFFKNVVGYEIKSVGPHPYFQEKKTDSIPVMIWVGNEK